MLKRGFASQQQLAAPPALAAWPAGIASVHKFLRILTETVPQCGCLPRLVV